MRREPPRSRRTTLSVTSTETAPSTKPRLRSAAFVRADLRPEPRARRRRRSTPPGRRRSATPTRARKVSRFSAKGLASKSRRRRAEPGTRRAPKRDGVGFGDGDGRGDVTPSPAASASAIAAVPSEVPAKPNHAAAACRARSVKTRDSVAVSSLTEARRRRRSHELPLGKLSPETKRKRKDASPRAVRLSSFRLERGIGARERIDHTAARMGAWHAASPASAAASRADPPTRAGSIVATTTPEVSSGASLTSPGARARRSCVSGRRPCLSARNTRASATTPRALAVPWRGPPAPRREVRRRKGPAPFVASLADALRRARTASSAQAPPAPRAPHRGGR